MKSVSLEFTYTVLYEVVVKLKSLKKFHNHRNGVSNIKYFWDISFFLSWQGFLLICFIVCVLIFLLSSFTYDSSVNTQFRLQRGEFLWELPSFSFYLFVPLYVLCDVLGILELLYVKYVIIMYGKLSLNLLVKIGEAFLDDLPLHVPQNFYRVFQFAGRI